MHNPIFITHIAHHYGDVFFKSVSPMRDDKPSWQALQAALQRFLEWQALESEEVASLSKKLACPFLSWSQKRSLLGELCRQLEVPAVFQNFLMIVLKNGRWPFLQQMVRAFQIRDLADRGVDFVLVLTAYAWDLQDRQNFQDSFERELKRKLSIEFTIHPELLGGFIFFWQDRCLDASVAGRLARLQRVMEQGLGWL